MSFRNFRNDVEGNTMQRQSENFSLTTQPSIYSLTLDEFQSTIGGNTKDFGSMNMDALLKNIWSAEENHQALKKQPQAMDILQKQGSLTLPRTLSTKTVDDVWKDIFREYNNGSNNPGGVHLEQPRELTLGEMTLEEFLSKAGVVREYATKPTTTKITNATGVPVFGFQQLDPSSAMPQNQTREKNAVMIEGRFGDIDDGGFNGSLGLHCGGIFGGGSPSRMGNNAETSCESPVRYLVNEGVIRGRKRSGGVDKVVERRQRRMIKNRESAARSRARKQAYTMELETEISKLKEMNQELMKKQARMEMKKNKALETMKLETGLKKRCLRRIHSTQW